MSAAPQCSEVVARAAREVVAARNAPQAEPARGSRYRTLDPPKHTHALTHVEIAAKEAVVVRRMFLELRSLLGS